MIHHLLDRPLRVMGDKRVEWECLCGQRVALPPQKVPRLTPVRTPDEKTGDNVVECAACYAGQDAAGEAPPPVGGAANEQDPNATLDQELGDEDDDQTAIGEDDDGTVLGEEDEEYPA